MVAVRIIGWVLMRIYRVVRLRGVEAFSGGVGDFSGGGGGFFGGVADFFGDILIFLPLPKILLCSIRVYALFTDGGRRHPVLHRIKVIWGEDLCG